MSRKYWIFVKSHSIFEKNAMAFIVTRVDSQESSSFLRVKKLLRPSNGFKKGKHIHSVPPDSRIDFISGPGRKG
jgi:hypothetical protein